jgi:hypothetical protein
MPSARVRSTEALVVLRGGLIAFRERALAAIGSLRQETQRTIRWLEQEQPHYWQHQERLGYDRVASCRVAYETCRMRTIAGHRSACIEEQVELRRAKTRLDYVQQQREIVRRWSAVAGDQANEFFGKMNPLERMLEYDVGQMIAALERMMQSLEAYTDGPPADDQPESTAEPITGPSPTE